MLFISSDTNIWLDFSVISRLSLPFRLPYTYIMYRGAMRTEIIDPPSLLSELKKLGLEGVDLTTEEFFYADGLYEKYRHLSKFDRTALAMAKMRKIPLLTGDGALRRAAEKEEVSVLGTIGILDRLMNGHHITSSEYRYCLEGLLSHAERRLPKEELRRRLDIL